MSAKFLINKLYKFDNAVSGANPSRKGVAQNLSELVTYEEKNPEVATGLVQNQIDEFSNFLATRNQKFNELPSDESRIEAIEAFNQQQRAANATVLPSPGPEMPGIRASELELPAIPTREVPEPPPASTATQTQQTVDAGSATPAQSVSTQAPTTPTPPTQGGSAGVQPIAQQAATQNPGTPSLMDKILNKVSGMPRDEAAALNRMNTEARDIMGGRLGMSDAQIAKTSFEDMLTKASGDANVSAFGKEVQRIGNEGGSLSKEGMESMMRNQADTGNMYGGMSRAGATSSPSGILRGIGGEGSGMENAAGILTMAAMAGGANAMMGGDFSTGAGVGLAGGLGTRAIARGLASSMGDIEGIAMKRMLGDNMVNAAPKITETVPAGTKIVDLSPTAQGKLTMQDINPNFKDTGSAEMSLKDYIDQGGGRTKMKTKQEAEFTRTEAITSGQARKQNLQAVQNLTDDELKAIGPGAKRMQSMMDPNKSKNTALNNRALTLGGAMLSGVAFTGQSDKRNYRRGFNAHRGNRI